MNIVFLGVSILLSGASAQAAPLSDARTRSIECVRKPLQKLVSKNIAEETERLAPGTIVRETAIDVTESGRPRPRSDWYKSLADKNYQRPYRDLNLKAYLGPRLKVYEGSLASQNGELIRIVDDLEGLTPGADRFISDFKKIQKRKPTFPEVLNFYESRIKLYEDAYVALGNELSRVKPNRAYLLKFSRKKEVLAYMKKTIQDARRYPLGDPRVLHSADELGMMASGLTTELRAAFSLPHVTKVNAYLNDLVGMHTRIDARLDEFWHQIQTNRDAWFETAKRYPELFPAERYSGLSNKDKLQRLDEWIRTREMDVIAESGNGKLDWIEVKKFGHHRTFEEYENGKSKSEMKQAEGYAQLLDFLGLKDKIRLKYYIIGTVDDSVVQHLESLGFEVIHSR